MTTGSEFKLPEVDQRWSIAQIAYYAPPPGWKDVFRDALPELTQISEMITRQEEHKEQIVPLRKDLFRAFELTPLHSSPDRSGVRVVIVGQDPYHTISSDGTPIATGLSFSVRRNDKVPPSLQNIYTEIKKEYPDFVIPAHGDLSGWAQQGVLMLNTSLTTTAGNAGAHSKYQLWMPFIAKILKAIGEVRPNCIFVLWGKDAQKLKPHLQGRPVILESAHPSPFSVKGFWNNNHFRRINQLLATDPFGPIQWQV